ncbi:MAG: CpaF family protein [Pirellulaceae bacterium]|jgi:pilus assembly protein CpaF|nr:CpaF family protein [Pirellulaceae bacterium]MCU0979243.1 CpaF family protein [Pirellulaceae bacterium]
MILATTPTASRSKRSRPDPDEHAFQRLKTSIHEELVESLDLSLVGVVDRQRLDAEVRSVADALCRRRAAALDDSGRRRMLNELLDEVFGLGPLEPLMADPAVTDVLVNHAHEVYVERHGRLELTDVIFADEQHVLRVIQRIVARIGRRIDEVCPMVDARLPDGSRINAVVPPLSLKGPTLSIRRFGDKPLDLNDLMSNRSILPEMAQFLSAAVDARMSFLIAGGTGSGKTTLLNALSVCIPPGERIITIEDSAELKLQHLHVVSLETRIANTEGAGEITQRDLVRNSLRMRPDRILVGEVRGAEALDMLQAMNTGHEGSLTTIHANDTRDALSRLEMMVAMTGLELPVHVVREYIAAGIKLVVHLARLKGGLRRVMRVSEIVGIQDGDYHLEDVFGFEQRGVDEDGVAIGQFYATGYRPQCLPRLVASGVELPDDLFEAKTF